MGLGVLPRIFDRAVVYDKRRTFARVIGETPVGNVVPSKPQAKRKFRPAHDQPLAPGSFFQKSDERTVIITVRILSDLQCNTTERNRYNAKHGGCNYNLRQNRLRP